MIPIEISKPIQNSDIMFLLDVSKSMDALDYREEKQSFSRLQVAKNTIETIVKKYPENRYGLTIFSEDFSTVIPLTQDIPLFLWFLWWVDSASLLSGGNDILSALEEVIQRFESEKTSGGIVVLSDFEFPKFTQSDVERYYQEGNFSASWDIKIFSVWIGSEIGNRIPIGSDWLFWVNYLRDDFQEVITRYDRESQLLFQQKTQSEFYFLKKYWEFWWLFSQLSKIPKRDFSYEVWYNDSLGRWFVIFWYGLFLLYLFLFYRERKKKI